MAKLDQWHPSQHIFTESLSGSLITETISCDGAENPKTGEVFHGRHVGIGELTFTGKESSSPFRVKGASIAFRAHVWLGFYQFCNKSRSVWLEKLPDSL